MAKPKKRSPLLIIALGALVLLCVCGVIGAALNPNTTAPAQPAATAGPTAVPPGYISRATLGDAWPLTVPDGVLSCRNDNQIVFTTAGTDYGVNASARDASAGLRDIAELVRPDAPKSATDSLGVNALIDTGLKLCGS